MRIEDITIEVRSVALGRLGQIDLGEVDDFKGIKRFRNVGNWSMSLAADYHMAGLLAQSGRGLVVTGPGNRVLMSGPVESFVKVETSSDSEGTWYYTGTDDMIHLADGTCWPVPDAAVTAQVDAHDVFAGTAEDALRHYVDVNRGPSAPADRRIDGLVLEAASLGRGGPVIGRARFDQMGPFLDDLASSGGIGFDIAQVGTELEFQVYVPSDVSDTVRMDIDNDMLEETKYGFSAPRSTRPIIAGQGQAEERLFLQKTTVDSLAAEVAWGRKIETFKDRRDTPDPDELEQEADTLLAEGGKTIASLSVKPSDETTMQYAVDWYLGDIVGVIVDGEELTSIVTEAIIAIDSDGVRIGATIGDPTGFDFESKLVAKSQDQERRIQNLEKNEGSAEDAVNWSTLLGKPIALSTDPGADRVIFWDDSASDLGFLQMGSTLVLAGTSLDVRAASTTQTGVAEAADGTETIAGTDPDRYVTPLSLQSLTAETTRKGLVERATDAEALALADAERYLSADHIAKILNARAPVKTLVPAGTASPIYIPLSGADEYEVYFELLLSAASYIHIRQLVSGAMVTSTTYFGNHVYAGSSSANALPSEAASGWLPSPADADRTRQWGEFKIRNLNEAAETRMLGTFGARNLSSASLASAWAGGNNTTVVNDGIAIYAVSGTTFTGYYTVNKIKYQV
jgi:hypothetical protein